MEYINPELKRYPSLEEISRMSDDEVVHYVIEHFKTRSYGTPPAAVPSAFGNEIDERFKMLLVEKGLATLDQANLLVDVVDRHERFIERKNYEFFNRRA